MTRRTASPAPAEPTPSQLWMAAQRLAAGDAPATAAVMAGLAHAVLIELIADRDPGFAELCIDCRRIHDMTPDETEQRLSRIAHDSAERLMMAGNATVTLRFLRDDPAAKGGRREAALNAANQNLLRMLHTISWEDLMEFRSLGRHAGPGTAANDAGPPGAVGFSP